MASSASTTPIGGGRPQRFCPLCGITDDHPRHTKTDGLPPNIAEHVDCCRERGCPDGSCDVKAERGMGDLRGRDLLKAIQKDKGLAEAEAERVQLFADPRSSDQILADAQAGRVALNPDGSK